MLQIKREIVRDGIFFGSDLNEINNSSANNLRDLGPKQEEVVPEISGILKSELLPLAYVKEVLVFKNCWFLAIQLTFLREWDFYTP